MKHLLLIGIGLILLAALGAGLFFYVTKDSNTVYNPVSSAAAVTIAEEKISSRTVPPGQYEYRNAFYKVSLLYPQNLVVREREGAGTTMTVTFVDPDTNEGFQMYILPYGDKQISKERFLLDDPSGIMASSTTIDINDISAGAFYSKDISLGDTYEVWFINKGFLYEVTTYKELRSQLDDILKSWEFL
jgi:hypothetical protein